MKLSFVRSGSAIVFSEFGERIVKAGDVILLGTNTLCGSEPEGWMIITTLYLDVDYVADQVFWQHAAIFTDRLDARTYMDARYAEPAQVLHLGEDRIETLMPLLDELVALSREGDFVDRYYRMQSILFAVMDVVAPSIEVTPTRQSRTQRMKIRPTLPRHRAFQPLRAEARQAAELLRNALSQRWTLDALAHEVHLSRAQLSRVFVDAYGKTPLAYLTMLRIEHMARLLRETDLTIDAAARQVGWTNRGHVARIFRQYVGVTPRRYRTLREGKST